MNKSKYYVSPDPRAFGARGWLRQINEKHSWGKVKTISRLLRYGVVTFFLLTFPIVQRIVYECFFLTSFFLKYLVSLLRRRRADPENGLLMNGALQLSLKLVYFLQWVTDFLYARSLFTAVILKEEKKKRDDDRFDQQNSEKGEFVVKFSLQKYDTYIQEIAESL